MKEEERNVAIFLHDMIENINRIEYFVKDME